MTLALKIVCGLLGGAFVVVTGVGLLKLSQKSKNENNTPSQPSSNGTASAPGAAPSATPGSGQSGQSDQKQTTLGQEAQRILAFIKEKHQDKFVLRVYLSGEKPKEDVDKLSDEQLKGLFEALEKDDKENTNLFFPQLSGPGRGGGTTPHEVVVEKTGDKWSVKDEEESNS